MQVTQFNLTAIYLKGTKLQWFFGDGSSSTDAAPTHTYQNYGDYPVTIVIDGDNGNVLKKNADLYIFVNKQGKASDLLTLPGLRHWNVVGSTITYNDMTPTVDTVSRFEDTFSVIVINYTTLVIKGDTLKGIFDTEGIREYYSFERPSTEFSWEYVHYYYAKDSIIYVTHPEQGGHNSGTVKLPSWPFGTTTSYIAHK